MIGVYTTLKFLFSILRGVIVRGVIVRTPRGIPHGISAELHGIPRKFHGVFHLESHGVSIENLACFPHGIPWNIKTRTAILQDRQILTCIGCWYRYRTGAWHTWLTWLAWLATWSTIPAHTALSSLSLLPGWTDWSPWTCRPLYEQKTATESSQRVLTAWLASLQWSS